MDWENSEREIQQDYRHGWQLRTAVAVSLVLHGVILVLVLWLMDQRAQNQQTPIPAVVRINLLPPPVAPEQQAVPSESAAAEQVVQAAEEQDPLSEIAEIASSDPVEPPAEQSPIPESLVELPQLVEIPNAPSGGKMVSEPVRVPDILTLRQTVRTVRELPDRSAELTNCTPAQRRNELFDCPDPIESDYAEALRNPIYFSFNQSQTDNQSSRAMGTIAGNQQQLHSGIQAFSLDGVDNEYLLEELSQGIGVYSGTGNTRLERLTEQIYRNDPAYQQAKRIMNPR